MDAREAILHRLVSNLEDLAKIYGQVLDVVKKEREFLVGARMDELLANNATKESLLQKVRLADELRLKIAGEAAVAVGAPSEQPRLLEIAAKAGAPYTEKLRHFHKGLETLIRGIAELNRANEEYARSALRVLDGAMNDIKQTITGKPTYEKKGTYKLGPDKTGNFMRKEA